MDEQNEDLAALAGGIEFYRAAAEVLLDVLLRQNPEHMKQHGNQYAKEAADKATSWLNNYAAKERHREANDSVLSEFTTVTIANGIEKARLQFDKHMKIKMSRFN